MEEKLIRILLLKKKHWPLNANYVFATYYTIVLEHYSPKSGRNRGERWLILDQVIVCILNCKIIKRYTQIEEK